MAKEKKMIYESLIRDNSFFNKMSSLIENKRLPNSLILHGSDGIGKEAHAIELCAMILCKSKMIDSCGKCYNCIKVKNLQNENINLIYPLPRGKIKGKNDSTSKAISDKTQPILIESLKNKTLNPYSKINLPGANKILINSIRELKKTIFLGSLNDNYKIVLILDAGKMCYPTQESGNSLLKILEEPPKKTIFILVTSEYDRLLDTIKSRSQSIKLNEPKIELISQQINSFRQSKYNQMIARMCNGNLRLAIEWSTKKDSYFEDIVHLIKKYIFIEDISQMPKAIQLMEASNKNGDINTIFILLNNILSDLIKHKNLIRSNDEDDFYTNLINSISEKYKDADWDKCIDLVDSSIFLLKTNANFSIQSMNFLMDFNRLLKGVELEIFSIESWLYNS